MSTATTPSAVVVVKRRPSEIGEWETGCHYRESNDAALCACSTADYYDRMYALMRRWRAEMQKVSTEAMLVDSKDLETLSLGWLLAHARDIYDDLCTDAAQFDSEEDSAENIKRRLDPSVIRDWFCWLHREMVYMTKEENRQKN